jgi:hypothetical protein
MVSLTPDPFRSPLHSDDGSLDRSRKHRPFGTEPQLLSTVRPTGTTVSSTVAVRKRRFLGRSKIEPSMSTPFRLSTECLGVIKPGGFPNRRHGAFRCNGSNNRNGCTAGQPCPHTFRPTTAKRHRGHLERKVGYEWKRVGNSVAGIGTTVRISTFPGK